jgi:hypothetical protein
MWNKDKQFISSGDASLNIQAGRDVNFFQADFPTELVDQKINEEVDILRKSRFFAEFDIVRTALSLGRRLVEGELSGGTDEVRSRALSWCARLLSATEELSTAEEYLNIAKSLSATSEVTIADAFITSKKGDKSIALQALASIDSLISRSAALMIIAHHEGAGGALEWLKKAGIEAATLDSDGKYFLLVWQLEVGSWNVARETLEALTAQDLEITPALLHMTAITYLLGTVPTELHAVVLKQVPFEAARFPLAGDIAALDARRTAQRHFVDAAGVARQLNCPGAATLEDEYALWLELMDPDSSDNGRLQLEAKLRDVKSVLRLVPLGLQFGIKLDLAAVEQEIERQIALHGGISPDAAIARFALAFTKKTPEDIANYVAQHYDELSKCLDPKSMRFLQVEMLSRAGQPERANECLNMLLDEGLSSAEEGRLRRIIAGAEGADPIETRKAQFNQSGSLSDLTTLVDELHHRKDWNDLCEYGALLLEKTRSIQDAERLTNALSNAGKTDQLVQFVRENPDLLLQSKSLQMDYAWALYQEGALIEAREELEKLSDDHAKQNYRALQVKLGIALGDWNSLFAFVANEYHERECRSAHDLMAAAQLALHLDLPDAKGLIFAAVAKVGDDAAVLAAAYFLASNAGWEDDAEVVTWLHKAAELSGNDGPIQKMRLRDVLDQKPDWDRQESETWKLLGRGEIPMFLAAQSLNKSLIDFILFPALANLSENDPRRRSAIPAYSGKRQQARLDIAGTKIGMDATALLTLSFLNLLDKALDAFDVVYVPHSTLAWLFEEKKKAAFHQPSRIRDAHQVRDFLAREVLEKFVPSTVADGDFAVQVGDELALLVAEAEKDIDNDDTQRIVVRSSPVHRVSSLMEEEADLSDHATVMSSCLAVVEKLQQKGQITAEEEKKARAYLQLHERPWPDQPEITDGAVLFLDDLTINNFLHLGVLEKLHTAGFRAIASSREVSEANALIAYEGISDKVNEAIGRIRSAVNSRIETGKIRVGRQRKGDESDEHLISQHPSIGVIALAGDCDAVISDDRLLNQHAHVDDGSAQAPIFTTLDLLGALVSVGAISADEQFEHRTLLRRAGYFFVTVNEDELEQHLNASVVEEGEVVETAELKAIRENILRVRMSDWLQLPKEAPWLNSTLKVFIRVLKSLWIGGADLSVVTARSDWILDQIDVRGWTHSLGPENGDNVVRIGRGAHILLFTLLIDASQEVKDAYSSWVEDRILAPIKEQFPDLYSWIVEQQRREIAEMAETELAEEKTT